jgi:hypothetical protein
MNTRMWFLYRLILDKGLTPTTLDKEQEYKTFSYHIILTLDQQQQNMKLPLLHYFLYLKKNNNIQTGMPTRWVPLVEQELFILPKCLSSPSVFSGVHVTRSLVLCVCFVDRCNCPFSFGHCVVCPSIYVFWLPLWDLQTLLDTNFKQYSLNLFPP